MQKTILIDAPASVVWRVITEPALMKEWMSDTPVEIHSSMTVGGPFSIHGKMEDYAYASKGTILHFIKEQRFSYNYWNSISRVADIPENYSVIDLMLEPHENGTLLSISQSNFIGEAVAEHAKFYWNGASVALKKLAEEIARRNA